MCPSILLSICLSIHLHIPLHEDLFSAYGGPSTEFITKDVEVNQEHMISALKELTVCGEDHLQSVPGWKCRLFSPGQA